MNRAIEGEVLTNDTLQQGPENQHRPVNTPPAVASEQSHQVGIFNPLDAEPVSFGNALQKRQENYDSLVQHLRGQLVPGVDFGRIHHEKGCYDQPCLNQHHWSDYDLWAAGADKIIGILNLSGEFPDLDKFKEAALSGVQIQDVILDCNIVSMNGQVIAQGVGACSRNEPGLKPKGSLNACMKRAAKRARVHACKALPTVGALFDDQDFWRAQEANYERNRARAQEIRKYSTGARLEVFTLGKKLKGKRFDEMDQKELRWILEKCGNMPDIWNAAKRALEALATSGSTTQTEEKPEVPLQAPPAADDDWLAEYEGTQGKPDHTHPDYFQDLEGEEFTDTEGQTP